MFANTCWALIAAGLVGLVMLVAAGTIRVPKFPTTSQGGRIRLVGWAMVALAMCGFVGLVWCGKIRMQIPFVGIIGGGNSVSHNQPPATPRYPVVASLASIQEPSGLCAIQDTDRSALVVDDKQPRPYVVTLQGDGGLTARQVTAPDSGPDPTDLEEVTRTGNGAYCAITSHRIFNDLGSCQLLKFTLRNPLTDPQWVVERPISLCDALERALGRTVNVQHWKRGRKDGVPNPWALEIEGMCYREGQLLLGLKYPVDAEGRALLLRYTFENGGKVDNTPIPLDLNHRGISALFYDKESEVLFVAANPHQKPRKLNREDELKWLGESSVYGFHWPYQPNGKDDNAGLHLDYKVPAPRPDAKLEGIDRVGDEVWMVYEGREGTTGEMVRRPYKDLLGEKGQ